VGGLFQRIGSVILFDTAYERLLRRKNPHSIFEIEGANGMREVKSARFPNREAFGTRLATP
jgi:aspartate/methionine/tyrosine aminotransferase